MHTTWAYELLYCCIRLLIIVFFPNVTFIYFPHRLKSHYNDDPIGYIPQYFLNLESDSVPVWTEMTNPLFSPPSLAPFIPYTSTCSQTLTFHHFPCLFGHSSGCNLSDVGSYLTMTTRNLLSSHHTDPQAIPCRERTQPFKSLGSLRNVLVFERKAIFLSIKIT